jgi:hypothetical protein
MLLLVLPVCICTTNGGKMSVTRIHWWYSASSTSTNGRNIGSIIEKVLVFNSVGAVMLAAPNNSHDVLCVQF